MHSHSLHVIIITPHPHTDGPYIEDNRPYHDLIFDFNSSTQSNQIKFKNKFSPPSFSSKETYSLLITATQQSRDTMHILKIKNSPLFNLFRRKTHHA